MDEINSESDPRVLASLIWSWLDHLKEPVLKDQEINILFKHIPSIYLNSLEHFEEISKSAPNWHELDTVNFVVNYKHFDFQKRLIKNLN